MTNNASPGHTFVNTTAPPPPPVHAPFQRPTTHELAKAFCSELFAQGALRRRLGGRPRITLTYAQSLDARIAGRDGEQLRLSGEESMVLTHTLRASHDAILVGVGTVLKDDPQLTVRLIPPDPTKPLSHPTPIILDTHLRTPPTCKLLTNYNAQHDKTAFPQSTAPSAPLKRPWLVCAKLRPDMPEFIEVQKRKTVLISRGADIREIPICADGTLSLPHLMSLLRSAGIKSLMIEGGQRVISSCLALPLFDALVVTVAPTFVGPSGVSFIPEGRQVPKVKHVKSALFGRDMVTAMIQAGANE